MNKIDTGLDFTFGVGSEEFRLRGLHLNNFYLYLFEKASLILLDLKRKLAFRILFSHFRT